MTHDASKDEFWRSVRNAHLRDRVRHGRMTEAEYMAAVDAARHAPISQHPGVGVVVGFMVGLGVALVVTAVLAW